MDIRLAAFGSESLITRVSQYVKHFEGIEFIPYIYETIEESPELVRKAIDADVLFFTGDVPYMLSKKVIEEINKPAVFMPIDEYAVTAALFQVKYHKKSHKFSMDITKSVDVYEICEELSLNIDDIYFKNFDDIYNENGKIDQVELINFHKKLWDEGKINIVVTCISSVYNALQRENIPVIRIIHPKKTIIDTLRRGIMFGELELSKKAQIVVGIVSIDNYQAIESDKGSYHAESNSLLLHQLLLDFSSDIHASIQKVGKDQFIIYSTKGSFELITHQYKILPVLNKIKKMLNVKINIGFGLGFTTKEAENHALKALMNSAENSEKCCAYIVTVDKQILGPLTHIPLEDKKNGEYWTQNDFLLSISKNSGINIQNVRKIIEFCRMKNFKPFSATELAEYMQISRRSAERFIKNIVRANFANVVGAEQFAKRGRPTTVYKLIDNREIYSK
jgi:hypothetical protein